MKIRHALALVASLFAFTLAPPALAADGGSRVPGIIGEAERWVTAAIAGPAVASEPTARVGAREGAATAEREAKEPEDADKPSFMDLVPNAALVARDWRGSTKLAGRTMLVDELRPTASNRMVVARVATGGRFTTFGQLGAGEWRIDTAMFPNARAYSEIAGQVGAGFELALSSGVRLGGEAQYTVLSRNATYGPDEVAPRILAFVLAVDGRF